MSQEEASEDFLSRVVLGVLGYAIPGGLILMMGALAVAFLMGSGKRLREQSEAKRVAAAQEQQAVLGQPSAAPGAPGPGSAPAGGEGAMDAGLAAVMKEGQKNYATCAACHGPDGKGMQVGPQTMAPTLVGSEIALGDPDRMALVILKGIYREPTSQYVGMMAALESAFNDEQLASVMTYVRQSFGNSAGPVTVEEVASAREKYKGVDAPGGVKREAIDQVAAGE